MKFKLVENIDQPLLEKGPRGQGYLWKGNDVGKDFNFDESKYVVHHINGDHSAKTQSDGTTNLALMPASLHNSFKKANESEWDSIISSDNYDVQEVRIKGRDFLLVLDKSAKPNKSIQRELVGASV